MKILSNTEVKVENTAYKITYRLVTKTDKKCLENSGSYGYIAEMYEGDCLIAGEKIYDVTDELSEAVRLFAALFKYEAAPLNLKYVIEDYFLSTNKNNKQEEKNMRNICCKEIRVKNTDYTITYGLISDRSSYGYTAVMYEKEKPISREEILNVTEDLSEAIRQFAIFVKYEATPLNLRYIIDDILSENKNNNQKKENICCEKAEIKNTDYTIIYGLISDGGLYGYTAEMYEKENLINREEILNVTGDLSEAIRLFSLFVKYEATPLNLKYIIEDSLYVNNEDKEINNKNVCIEKTKIENTNYTVKHILAKKTDFGKKTTYGFIVEMYEGVNLISSVEITEVTSNLHKAISLYITLVKYCVTPLDLEYVIEDCGININSK